MEGMEAIARKRTLKSQILILPDLLILWDLLILHVLLILCDLQILQGHRMLQDLSKKGKDESQKLNLLSCRTCIHSKHIKEKILLHVGLLSKHICMIDWRSLMIQEELLIGSQGYSKCLLLHGMFYGKASAGWKISNVQENLSK
jgi:hypothetical protein